MHRRCIMLHLILLFLLWVALCRTYGMAESRAAKQARVGRLRRDLPHISQSALIAILKEAKREWMKSASLFLGVQHDFGKLPETGEVPFWPREDITAEIEHMMVMFEEAR